MHVAAHNFMRLFQYSIKTARVMGRLQLCVCVSIRNVTFPKRTQRTWIKFGTAIYTQICRTNFMP